MSVIHKQGNCTQNIGRSKIFENFKPVVGDVLAKFKIIYLKSGFRVILPSNNEETTDKKFYAIIALDSIG